MKPFHNIFKPDYRDFIALSILAILLFSLFLPRINYSAWILAEDGEFMDVTQRTAVQLKEGQFSSLIQDFRMAGRFIPAAILTFTARFLTCGLNATCFYIINFLLVLLSCICLYMCIKALIPLAHISFLGGLIYILFLSNWDNFYRVYPIELFSTPALSVFALAIVMIVQTRSNQQRMVNVALFTLGSFAFAYAMFLKETTIAVVFPIMMAMVWFLVKKNNKSYVLAGSYEVWEKLSIIVFSILSLWYVVRVFSGVTNIQQGSYSARYEFSFMRMAINLGKYIDIVWNNGGPLIFFLLIVALVLFRKLLYDEKSRYILGWITFFFLWVIGFVMILLPWQFAIGRYLMPGVWALAIATALTWHLLLGEHSPFSRPSKRAIQILGYIFLSVYVIVNLARINHMQNWVKVRDTANNDLVEFLATTQNAVSTNLWFVYPKDTWTCPEVKPLLRNLKGVNFALVDKLDTLSSPTLLKAGDFIIVPKITGDGHSSTDGRIDVKMPPLSMPYQMVKEIKCSASSTTIYLDSPIYNLIKGFKLPIPRSVMGDKSQRSFFDHQLLAAEWTIYQIVGS